LRRILSDPQFPALVEHLEAAAWLELSKARAPARVLETLKVDGSTLIIDRSRNQPVNRVLELGIDGPLTSAGIDQIIEAFAAAGIDAFTTCLLPIARPTHAPRLLEQAGFKRGPQQAAVVRPVGGVDPADPFFRIRVAVSEDAHTVEELMTQATGDPLDWTRVVSGLLGSDKCRFHIAEEGSRAYALGGFLRIGDSAFLFTRSWVLSGYETRGIQAALVQTALRDAEEQGCSWVTTILPVTAETRMRRFERMGFEVIFQRRVYFYGQEPLPNDLGDPLSRSVLI
jgi:GNAT superfamily N-acetyltransferase